MVIYKLIENYVIIYIYLREVVFIIKNNNINRSGSEEIMNN
jgi:hypothetical protein